MDEVIWVEVLSRHRDIIHRHRCAGPEIFVGRGYDNDVVVDDPYVAARHLRIARDPLGSLVAEDLGSVNGLFLGKSRQRQERILIDGGEAIRVGHTFLRVRDPHHKVAPERAGEPPRHTWPLQLILVLAIVALEVFSSWQREIGEVKLSHYLDPVVRVGLIVGGWTTAWAVLSRIFSGQAHLERVLLYALSGMLTFSFYNEISNDLAFALSWKLPMELQYVMLWAALGTTAFLHLREIGRAHLWLKGGLLASAAALAIAFQTLGQSEARDADSTISTPLLPPAARLKPLQSEDAFFAEALRLKEKLDTARGDDRS
jgi:hypothetical protein